MARRRCCRRRLNRSGEAIAACFFDADERQKKRREDAEKADGDAFEVSRRCRRAVMTDRGGKNFV